jgi:hypothetical protein
MPRKYSDYIPDAQALKKMWYQYQIDNASVKGAAIGMTLLQITAYKAFCQAQIDDINALIAAKAAVTAAVVRIKTNSKVNDAGIRTAVTLAKTNTAYTPAGGADLKIVDTHISLDFEFFTPTFEYFVFLGYVRLKFDFHGLESMNIYCRIKGTTDWGRPIANVQHSPFDDHHGIFVPAPPAVAANSEAREYMIIGVFDDVEVGFPSAIHPVVFGG